MGDRAPIVRASAAKPLLKPGDILLSHVRKPDSAVDHARRFIIQTAQSTPYAHAALYVGEGEVVHARAGGVVSMPLKEFSDRYDYQVYRPKMKAHHLEDAVDFAQKAIGKGFSMAKSVRGWLPAAPTASRARERLKDRKEDTVSCSGLIAAALAPVNWGKKPAHVLPVDFAKSKHTSLVATVVKKEKTAMHPITLAAFQAELHKEGAGAPTRGGFMMASDIPAFRPPRLDQAIQKNSGDAPPQDNPKLLTSDKYAMRVKLEGDALIEVDAKGKSLGKGPLKEKGADMLPDGVTFNSGDFKRSKYAMSIATMGALVDLMKTGGVGITPAGQLAKTQSVGAPKVTAPPGPSIADIAKPKGAKFGIGIPGAFKTKI